MHNSSNNSPPDEDKAIVSQVYQSAAKPMPASDVDSRILKIAQQRIDNNNTRAKTDKYTNTSWLYNRAFHGAIAACFVLVCLVYIVPPAPPVLTTKTSSTEPSQTTQAVPSEENDNAQLKREQLAQLEKTASLAQRKIANTPRLTAQALSDAASTRQPVFESDMSVSNLIEQNKILTAQMRELQQITKMSHQQIMSEDIKPKQLDNNNDFDEMEVNGNNVGEQDSPLIEHVTLLTQYKDNHTKLKSNLRALLTAKPSTEILNSYSDVLSPEEISVLTKMVSKTNKP